MVVWKTILMLFANICVSLSSRSDANSKHRNRKRRPSLQKKYLRTFLLPPAFHLRFFCLCLLLSSCNAIRQCNAYIYIAIGLHIQLKQHIEILFLEPRWQGPPISLKFIVTILQGSLKDWPCSVHPSSLCVVARPQPTVPRLSVLAPWAGVWLRHW